MLLICNLKYIFKYKKNILNYIIYNTFLDYVI